MSFGGAKKPITDKGIFGLVKAPSSNPFAKSSSSSSSSSSAPKKSVFGGKSNDSDSDEDSVNAQVKREAERKRLQTRVVQEHQKALEDDPNVFDYDGLYDQMQDARTKAMEKVKAESTTRQSKYIGSLQASADLRNKEHDRAMERKLQKEREAEEAEFGDKGKYVTSAYKKKLQDEQKWKEEQKALEEKEQREDVSKKEHHTVFYSSLLQSRTAMTDVVLKALNTKKVDEEVAPTKQPQPVAPAIIQPPKPQEEEKSSGLPKSAAESEEAISRPSKRRWGPEIIDQSSKAEEQQAPVVTVPLPPSSIASSVDGEAPSAKRPKPEIDEQTAAEAARERYLKRMEEKKKAAAAAQQ